MAAEKVKDAAGFGSAATMPHAGILHFSELVQSAPPDLRPKALRVVAAKVILAARVDSSGIGGAGVATVSDALGHKLRGELEAKIAKWQEPDKQKQKKALPKPEDKPKKKRAGKRVRRQKERFAEQADYDVGTADDMIMKEVLFGERNFTAALKEFYPEDAYDEDSLVEERDHLLKLFFPQD